MSKTGVAFSGGGVRSAALCSGVLRRLLQIGTVPDYLSCVSGGGYTGTAYLDWKYRNEQKDDPKWHKEFFDHMRNRIGVMCDWRNPLQGIVDTISFLVVVLFVSFILSCVNWFGFAFPTAYIIDYFFGDLLRVPFACPDEKTHNFTSSDIIQNSEVSELFNMTDEIECVPKFGPEVYFTFMTFAILFVLFLLCYVINKVVSPSLKAFANILFNLSGFTFAMVFLPWFLEEFIVVTPLWFNGLILVLSVFLWLGIPPLRDKASLAMVIYVYAYAVKWRVYKTNVLFVVYTKFKFDILMWISGIVIWMVPLFGLFQRNCLHTFYRILKLALFLVINVCRWRLQKAFYSPESTAATNCLATCQRMFPTCTCCKPTVENLNRPLTLEDLSGMAPEYICNVTVHDWRMQNSNRNQTFELLTMAPSGIETIGNKFGKSQFENRLHPRDIKLSVAMATSAAAVSYHMGRYKSSVEAISSLQRIIGFELGKSLTAEPKRWTACHFRLVAILIEFILALPFIVLPMIPLFGGSEAWNQIAVIFFLVLVCLLTSIAVFPTGAENPGCWETLVRWCVVNIYHVRLMRELLGAVNVGPTPPPVLYLSDAGHVENLGILSLLKRRLERIVVMNAGCVNEDLGLANSLLYALSQAREKLHCSFTGTNRQDVCEDIRATLVERPPNKQLRSYRFKVEYFDLTDEGEEEKVGEGEILYLLPRHPVLGLLGERRSWDELIDEVKIDIEADLWGSGPELEPEEVDRLTCCCCECCHCSPLQFLSGSFCGVFPNHITANQFFTPAMFTAYHREGYRACIEGRAAEFLGGAEMSTG